MREFIYCDCVSELFNVSIVILLRSSRYIEDSTERFRLINYDAQLIHLRFHSEACGTNFVNMSKFINISYKIKA